MRTATIKVILLLNFSINPAMAQNSLPPCNSQNIRDCVGEKYLFHGRRYVGEFKDYEFDGNGTIYEDDGSIYRAGIWRKGALVEPSIDKGWNPLEATANASGGNKSGESSMGSNIRAAKAKCGGDLGFKTGTEGFGKCVLQLSK